MPDPIAELDQFVAENKQRGEAIATLVAAYRRKLRRERVPVEEANVLALNYQEWLLENEDP